MKPLVSLVTPVYNAMPYFREYLSSVMRQTWRPLQFIAVDDGSTDGSWEYLTKAIEDLKAAEIEVKIMHIPHTGQAAAVNAALPAVSGDFFTWCDADDILMPDSIEKKAIYLLEHPEFGMVRSDAMVAMEDTGIMKSLAEEKDRCGQNIFDALFHNRTYCCGAGCYMVETRLFFECYPQKQIPFSPEGQNLQLLLPPASRTDCGFLPDKLSVYHIRSSGHSNRKRSYTEQLARIENFARLCAEILPYCDCDRQYYLLENERMRRAERGRLLRFALLRAREELKR